MVTSQSNLAVDNVLERLPEDILFMRLATDEDKISNKIKEHSFQSKLKNWVKDTQEKSNDFFNQHFQTKVKDKALVAFYNLFSNINLNDSNAFLKFSSQLRWQIQYIKELFEREEAVKQKVKKELEDEGLYFDKTFGESLFEKLILEFESNTNLQSNIKMLDIQYRIPRQIGNLISRFFYNSKLKNPDTSLLPNFDKDKFHELKFMKPMASIFDAVEVKEIEVPNSIIFVSTSNQENPNDNDIKLEQFNNFVITNEDGRSEPLIEINIIDKF